MTMSDWESIFAQQEALQNRLGYDFDEMTAAERVDYVRLNVLALTDELHEALQETTWKPWATYPDGPDGAFVDRDAYVKELIDALHFLLNLFLVGGASPDEVFDRYVEKNQVNHDRQNRGYVAIREKCGRCHRELEGHGPVMIRLPYGPLCLRCEAEITNQVTG